MTKDRNQDQTQADRFAAGSGGATNNEDNDPTGALPGVTPGVATILPDAGAASDESRAEGTIGAVGEMDFTGAPAGTTSGAGSLSGGNSADETRGGASGGAGGAASGGGTAPGTSPDNPGPQSVESTLAVLGDNEQSTTAE